MKTLFITGASGFIGRQLINHINNTNYDTIYCLSRTGKIFLSQPYSLKNIKVIKADLMDVQLYTEFLASSDIVLHLAAVTGKASPQEYININADGTRYLVQQCEKLGVKNFLYVSTIAITFPDISLYYYAQSKKIGEDIVKNSHLNFTIVRPTIVIGNDGSIWINLAKLSKKPFPVIFGGGKIQIQPIHIDDLVDIILYIINENIFYNETYDLGGAETITFEEFIQLIHIKYKGKRRPVLHIPLGLMIKILKVAEKYFYNQLPINVGQLSPFLYDSVAEENRLNTQHNIRLTSLKEGIQKIIDSENAEILSKKLDIECSTFCRYLIDMQPDEYILKKYKDAHTKKNTDFKPQTDFFDRFLINFSLRNRFFTKLSDSYTRVFFRHSIFRKKLLLLLAILESTHPYHRHIDSVDSHNKTNLFIIIILRTLFYSFSLVISALFMAPLHIVSSCASKLKTSN